MVDAVLQPAAADARRFLLSGGDDKKKKINTTTGVLARTRTEPSESRSRPTAAVTYRWQWVVLRATYALNKEGFIGKLGLALRCPDIHVRP